MTAPQKSSFKLKFPQALAAAGLSAVLVGCGGGGSESTRMDPEPTEPAGPTPAETQITAIKRAISNFEPALDAVNNTASPEIVNAADAALAEIQKAIDNATDVDATTLDGYKTAYTSSKQLLDIRKGNRTAYIKKQEDERLAAERKARNDAAKLYYDAIDNWMKSSDLTVLPKGTANLETAYDTGKKKTEITLDKTDGTALTGQSATAPEGWTAAAFSLSDKSSGKVFTNRTGTQKTNYSWGTFWGASDARKDPSPLGAATTINASTDVVTLNAGETTAASLLHRDDISAAGFLPSKLGENKDLSTGYSQSGTLLGIRGTFACADANGCRVSVDEYGYVRLLDNTYGSVIFTPESSYSDLDKENIAVAKADTDFMHFGYWLTTTGSGSSMKHTIDTFARAEGYGILTTEPHNLAGTVTYSGSAAGIYALKKGSVTDPDYYNGEFTADANLTAHFNQSATSASVAPNKLFTINGSISNFKGSHDLSGWELELKSASLTKTRLDSGNPVASGADAILGFSSATAVADRVFKGDTTGGGEWQGTFYGLDNRNPPGGTATTASFPAAVVGEFNGQFSNGNVAGVFGAEIDD